LHIEFGTMLVQLISFLILLALVLKFAMKPAMKVLNERQQYIQNQIQSAESAREEASRIAAEQRKTLEEAKKQAFDLIENARAQKERESEEIYKAAQERAERLIKEASAEISREKEQAIAELRDQVATLSVLIASKIIEKELDAKQQQVMIDDFLKQVGGQQL
jgi:F-type H+-transporting ATPase subunit b